MISIKHFPGNPNPMVATFKIDQDILGIFGKIIIPRGSNLEKYSPLAQMLFPRSASIVRVDLTARDVKTYVSIARKLVQWTTDDILKVEDHLKGFFAKPTPAVFIDAIVANVVPQKPFAPANIIQKLVQASFNEQVNPVLASDGGAMELLNVEIKPTGEISADVALIGSCNGCGSAETDTLVEATKKIRKVLEAAKAKEAAKPEGGNSAVKMLAFKGISIREIPDLVITRN